MKRFLIGVALAASTCAVHAQTWSDTGNPAVVPGTNFLGSINSARLDVITNNIRRLTLLPDATYAIGGFPAQVKNGSLLLSPNVDGFYAGGAPGPFTGLHLAAATNNTQQAGYRSNMGNGITLTGNNDQMYVGQLFRGLDFTDAAIVWSDNPGEFLADRLTFNFTSSYNAGATSGNSSFRGLQTLLIQPAGSGQEAFVGVGDFDAASETPEERLDVLDGKVRVRQLPTDPPMDTETRYVVSDANGVLGWRNIPDPGPGSADCDWTINTAGNRITTAWQALGSNGNCPEEDWRLGVGTNNPSAKLHVYRTAGETGATTSLYTRAHTTTGVTGTGAVFALDAEGTHYGTNPETYAIRARQSLHGGSSTDEAYGVQSLVQPYGDAAVDVMYGLHTRVNGTPTSARYAVYAHSPASSSYQSWAGWFVGNVHATGVVTMGSDAGLKSDIEPLTNANEVLQALHPKRYRFQVDAFPHLGLPEGERLGLIAQEVQDVLPNLVVPTRQPAIRDEEGQVIAEAHEYLSLNYIELVPLLIAGYQEQQQALEEMRDQLGAIQEQLALCCSSPDRSESPLAPEGDLKLDPATERLLRMDPNPFTDRTTIRYTLERGGRTMLLVNSSDGKQLDVLQEALLPAGEHQQEWYTDHLAPGVYYVTLLLDGEPLVKRAVKVR